MPIGQPVAAGTNVLVYTVTNSVPYVQVLDPTTGRVRWRRTASVSYTPGGVQFSPGVLSNDVIYLRPENDHGSSVRIVLADGATGRDKAVSSGFYDVTTEPASCGTQICFGAWTAGRQVGYTMNPTTAEVRTRPPAWDGAREIGPSGLVAIQRPGQPEALGRLVGDKLLWSKRIDELLGPDRSVDGGWDFSYLEKANLFVGSVGPHAPGPRAATEPVGRTWRTWALDAATGKGNGRCRAPIAGASNSTNSIPASRTPCDAIGLPMP